MPTWIKYPLFQLPQWFALVSFFGFWSIEVPCRVGPRGLFCFLVVKDFAMYPFIRHACEKAKAGTEQLIGTKGVARERLAPDGYIKIRRSFGKHTLKASR
jgi:hypothetical protein